MEYNCMLAGPRSLAATYGVSFDFLSSGYYNVLVHQVKIDGWFTLGSHHCCLDLVLFVYTRPFGHVR